MLLRRCTDTEIRFDNSLSYLPSHSQACLTLHCKQLRPVGHRKAVRIQHRPGTGKAFCVRRGHAFLPGCASGQDGNVDGASRVAGGMRGHSAGRAAGMGAGSGRLHASPVGHQNQENEAKEILKEYDKKLNGKIKTKISKIKNYCKAEDYHQRYIEKNR